MVVVGSRRSMLVFVIFVARKIEGDEPGLKKQKSDVAIRIMNTMPFDVQRRQKSLELHWYGR